MSKIFISYSHKDEECKDQLVTHLSVLQQDFPLELWNDRDIQAGDDWEEKIKTALDSCNIAIFLISAHFLSSKFITTVEVPTLLQRRQRDGLRVMPLILRPCAWKAVTWLSPIQARPKDGRPLLQGTEVQIDTDLAAFTEEIWGWLKQGEPIDTTKTHLPLPPDKIHTAKLPTTSATLFGRDNELDILDDAWKNPHTHILSLVAWGGVGKSALVNGWLNRLAQNHYAGARRVYGWSFYSQGAKEDGQASADTFLEETLKWFGETDSTRYANAWDKGIRRPSWWRRNRRCSFWTAWNICNTRRDQCTVSSKIRACRHCSNNWHEIPTACV